MTNEPPPAGEPLLWSDVSERFEESAMVLFAVALLMGGLRGVSIIVAGPGGLVPWIEAAYAFLLHLGAGTIVATGVRGLGIWLGAAAGRAEPAAAGRSEAPPPEAPAIAVREPARREDPGRWRDRVHAAREADDPAGVLDLREQAPEGLDEQALKDLDADLGKWLLSLVHRRLRSGPLRADLVELVERGSETFGHTKEGASLRAALPTLRRGAGLCPRCAKPYTGVWEACPDCMGRPEPPPPELPGLIAADEDDYEPRDADGRWFVDPDDRPGDLGRADR